MFSRIKPHVILGTSRAVKAAICSTHYSVALKKKYFTSRTADVPSSASVIVVGECGMFHFSHLHLVYLFPKFIGMIIDLEIRWRYHRDKCCISSSQTGGRRCVTS